MFRRMPCCDAALLSARVWGGRSDAVTSSIENSDLIAGSRVERPLAVPSRASTHGDALWNDAPSYGLRN